MSIIKKECYTVKCDCCGEDLEEMMLTPSDAEVIARVSDFLFLGGKHYCLNCYEIEGDKIVTADGKVWNSETKKEIKNI